MVTAKEFAVNVTPMVFKNTQKTGQVEHVVLLEMFPKTHSEPNGGYFHGDEFYGIESVKKHHLNKFKVLSAPF